MNKVILMGRLVKDPEVRYTQGAEPFAIANYTIAVNRRFKREGEPDADFINIVAFRRDGEFAEKYFKKGMQVSIVGHLQVRSYDDKEGVKKWVTEVVIEEQHFAESKKAFEERGGSRSDDSFVSAPSYQEPKSQKAPAGFQAIGELEDDEDLPF